MTTDVRALHVAGLPAKEAGAELDIVATLGPAYGSEVLEVVVDVLQGNERAVTDVAQTRKADRSEVGRLAVQVRRERTQTSRDDGIGAFGASRVEGQGKIVDPGKGGAEVHQKVLGEDVGKAEAVLLRGIRRRTVEVKLAAADLESCRCIGSKPRRSEGIDFVVVVTGKEEIAVVELMIHADIEAVGELRPLGAGDVVVR